MRPLLLATGFVVALIVGTGFYAYDRYRVPGPLAADRAVVVPRGRD
ncbi:MAG: aminodeoxychorismate lyase, partial [Alphaproteobacteria bacterium]